jgi:hypothetical protein
MPLRNQVLAVAFALVMVLAQGCGSIDGMDRALDSASGAAVEGLVGPTTGSQSGGGSAGPSAPMAGHGYTMALFQALFYQGGYNITQRPFRPGEYVQWRSKGMSQGESFEKALLRRRDDGAEWWRVASHSKEGSLTIEALVAPPLENGSRRILRLRMKNPGSQAREVPVSEQSSEKWVLHGGRTLTEESYKGLKVGTAEVGVPAGTFTADHLRTSHPGRQGTVHWWISDRVPGGIVKYQWQAGSDRQVLALEDFGSDAGGSRLGAF